MGSRSSPYDFHQERKAVLIVVISQFVLLLLGGGLAIVAWRSFRWVTLLIAAIAILSLALLSTYLYLRFNALPALKNKKLLIAKELEVQRHINDTESVIKRALHERENIAKNEVNKFAQTSASHNQFIAELKMKRWSIATTAKKELSDTLKQLQERFIAIGLVRNSIQGAKIQGVGSKMKERLAARGILSAADVSVAGVSSVEGFGEAKKTAVIKWRRALEKWLDSKMPRALPEEVDKKIKSKYISQYQQTKIEEKRLVGN